MTAQKFRKKPIEIEAIQWTGGNHRDVVDFATRPSKSYPGAFTELFIELNTEAAIGLIGKSRLGDMLRKGCTAAVYVDANSEWLGIETGEWIIQDAKGFYPCKPDIFAATYDTL